MSVNFPSAIFSTYGAGSSFNASTGVLDTATTSQQVGCGFICKGLPLGKYEVEFLNNNGGQYFTFSGFDAITPIHINDVSLKTVKSLEDKRNFSPIPKTVDGEVDLGKAKAMLVYNMTSNKIIDSFNVSQVLDRGTGAFRVYFTKPFKHKEYGAVSMSKDDTYFSKDHIVDISTGSFFDLVARTNNGTYVDREWCTILFFGELVDE